MKIGLLWITAPLKLSCIMLHICVCFYRGCCWVCLNFGGRGAFADYDEIAGTVKMIKKEYNTLHLGQHVFQQTRKPIRLQSDTMTAFFCRGNRKTKI